MATSQRFMEPSTPSSNAADGNHVPCSTPVVHKTTHPDGAILETVQEAPHKNHPCMQRCLPTQLEPLAWIAGKWIVFEPGKCQYPTIKNFTYAERVEFTFTGQPMLDYKAESWNPSVGCETLLHREEGFLRIKPDTNKVALILAHNFGVVEILEGVNSENKLVLESTGLHRMSFAAEPAVTKTRRTFLYHPETEELEHVMEMQTTKTPLTEHLRIKYKRGTHHIPDVKHQ